MLLIKERFKGYSCELGMSIFTFTFEEKKLNPLNSLSSKSYAITTLTWLKLHFTLLKSKKKLQS